MESHIHITKANERHIKGIANVCTKGYWATYGDTHPKEYIERITQEFYNPTRISKEVATSTRDWGGYFVAVENEKVVGAGGGGMTGASTGELFVLYIDPIRRKEGIGTAILAAITTQQINCGATEQWVSVQKGNHKGIPFYEARGFIAKEEKRSFGNQNKEDFISLRYYRTLNE